MIFTRKKIFWAVSILLIVFGACGLAYTAYIFKRPSLAEQIKNMTPEERNLAKIAAFTKIRTPVKYAYEGIDIKITSLSMENSLLKVMVSAQKNGKEIKLDLPFYYQNPPILVSIGTKRTAVEYGEEVELNNYREDIPEALRRIVGETVKLQSENAK